MQDGQKGRLCTRPPQARQDAEPLSDAITRQAGTRLATFFNILC
jgi:hypothetical protein